MQERDIESIVRLLQQPPDSLGTPLWRLKTEDWGEVSLEANRAGLIAVAISLVDAAMNEQTDSQPTFHAIPSPNHAEDPEAMTLSGIIRNEGLTQAEKPPEVRRTLRDRIALAGCGIVAFGLAMLFMGGIIFWYQLIAADF